MGRPFATLVVTATLLCGPSALAYAGPANDSGALLRKADGHRKKGEHQAAARAYAEYYGSQAQAERASETGAYIIDLAASSYVASGDTADLEACRVLLREFLADVAAVHGDAEQPFAADAKSQLAKLDEQLASPPEPEPEPKPEPEPDPEPDPDPEQEPEPEPEREVEPSPNPIVDRTPHGRDKLGIGLVVGGAVAIAGGIGVLVAGSQFLPQARARVRDAEANTTETEVVDSGPFIEQRRRQGNILMGVGGGVIAVGLAATIWGAVRLAKHRKRSRATVSLGGTSVVVHGRF